MYMSKLVLLFFVLTVSFFVKEGSAHNITLIVKSTNYTCNAGNIILNDGEFVQIFIKRGKVINFASCLLNKHKEELTPSNTTKNNYEMRLKIEAKTYMSGKWICTTLTDRNDTNSLCNSTNEDIVRRNSLTYKKQDFCTFDVTVIDRWGQYSWIYIGLGAAVFTLIIIAETVLIVYYRKKVRKPKRLEELSLNQFDETIEAKARYSVRPGLMGLLSKNNKSQEVDEDGGSLYETLDAVCLEIPPPPPIETLPPKSKKSFGRKLSKTFLLKEDDPSTLPKKESLGNKSMRSRPPMPLPEETTKEAAVKQMKKKEDHEHLIEKESRDAAATTKQMKKKENHEPVVGKETRGKSGSVGKFIASFNHNSTNPEPTHTKRPKDILPATNKPALSELNMILKNRTDGTMPTKPRSTNQCPAKPEPKLPVEKQTASESKTLPKPKPTPIAKPAVTRPATLTKPDTASTQASKPRQPTQQVKQTSRPAQPAPTKPQPAPATTQTLSQPVMQTPSLRPGKMKPQSTPDMHRKPLKPPMALPPDVVTQTGPPTPRPIAVKPAQCSEKPVYEEYDENSDDEWTYEALDKYNIYSN